MKADLRRTVDRKLVKTFFIMFYSETTVDFIEVKPSSSLMLYNLAWSRHLFILISSKIDTGLIIKTFGKGFNLNFLPLQ